MTAKNKRIAVPIFLFLFFYVLLAGSCTVFANASTEKGQQMPKSKMSLQGDKSFKKELLKKDSVQLESNALFVSPKGKNTNKGSITKPLRTIQKALDLVRPGQTIYVRKGTYSAFSTFKRSGRKGAYITLRNYPGEMPRLTGKRNKSGAILKLSGKCYIKIQGLNIGMFSAPTAQGILLNDSEHHVIIKKNRIHHLVTTKPGEKETGEANAVLCYGDGRKEQTAIHHIAIENNAVYENVTGWCEAISIAGNVKYVNVINNKVYDNTNIGIDFYGNAGYCSVKSLDQPRYCLAAGNHVYGSVCPYAECAGIYADGAKNVILENNTVHDCMYGIEIGAEELQPAYPATKITVRNNLVYNNSAGGIRIGGYDAKKSGYVTNTEICHNTVVNNTDRKHGWNGEISFAKCNGIRLKNNLIYKKSGKFPLIGGDLSGKYVKNIVLHNNGFYSSAGAQKVSFEFAGRYLEGIKKLNTYAGHPNFFGKPVFHGDYTLKGGSFGINRGLKLPANLCGTIDLKNRCRTVGRPDLGAFEYQK